MRVEVCYYNDDWQIIKDAALFTIHKFKGGVYPDSEWKRRILMSEHSPIRIGRLIVKVYDIPSFVINHFVRHHEGFTPFVASLRDDRSVWEDGKVPDRNTPNSMMFDGNFQSFINVSRKRECNCASSETRAVWRAILDEVKKYEPELEKQCVRECVYRNGLCPEMFTCKFNKKEKFQEELKEYLTGFEDQVV